MFWIYWLDVYSHHYLIAETEIGRIFNGGNMNKIKFCDIVEPYIAIHFSTQVQLEKLVDYLKAYGYYYGTSGSDLHEIKELGIRYFSYDEFGDNRYLSLDRSKSHYHGNYVSCGLGYEDIKYDFKDIDWNVD